MLEADWTLLRKLDICIIGVLFLAANLLTDAVLEKFAKHKWDNLVSFHLNKNEFTNKGIVTLMKVKFPQLKSFWLSIIVGYSRFAKGFGRLSCHGHCEG